MTTIVVLLALSLAWLAAEIAAIAATRSKRRSRPAPQPAGHPDPRIDESRELRILAVIRQDERYVFLFVDTPANRQVIIEIAQRYAADPDLSFTPDAADTIANQLRVEPTNRTTTLRRIS